MAHYLVLGNWTEAGMAKVKEAPRGMQAFRKAAEAAGVKVLETLFLMGPYDFVVIAEAPSDEVVNQLVLQAGMVGNSHTLTSKGWTEAEFAKLAERL